MDSSSEPVVNINVLVDSKKEYVDQLERGMTEPVFGVLKRMMMDAINVSHEANMDPVSAFVQLVEEIPEWTPEIVDEETEQVVAKIPYLRDLLKAYFVCTSMIMGSIRMSRDPNQTMRVRVPTPSRFVHMVMKSLGSEIADDVDRFVTEVDGGNYKLHRRNAFDAIREAVKNTVHVLMPIDDILKEYMGELLNKDTFKGGEEEMPDQGLDPAETADVAPGDVRQVQVARQALVRKPMHVPAEDPDDIGGVNVEDDGF